MDNFQAGSSRGEKIPATPSGITLIVGGDASATPAWDVNGDGTTNILDLVLISQDFGKLASLNSRTDVNGDGVINILDLIVVAQHLGESTGAAAPLHVAIGDLD